MSAPVSGQQRSLGFALTVLIVGAVVLTGAPAALAAAAMRALSAANVS
ncbi:hypothetical protein [Cryobacterium sp. Y29]|nr:hypothetical protein [Cryobacterium sp. Y29]